MSAQLDYLVEALKKAILEADQERERKQLFENNAPGLRPHPEDTHKSLRGGSSIRLGPESKKFKDSIRNESVYVTEWVVKFKPSVASIQTVVDGNTLVTRAKLTVAYDGEQSIEDQPLDNFAGAGIRMPLAGKCIPVHGRTIQFLVERQEGGASEDIDVEAAIVPGRPFRWYDSDDDVASAAESAVIPLKTYTQRISILVNVSLGDTWEYLDAAGNSLGLFNASVGLNSMQPIQPDACFVRYNTADVGQKVVVVSFEIVS